MNFSLKETGEDLGLPIVRIEPTLDDGIKGAHRSIYIERNIYLHLAEPLRLGFFVCSQG